MLYFEVTEEVMKQRLLKRGETSGRADDNEDTILQRLRTFTSKTEPVIKHYADKGKVIKVSSQNCYHQFEVAESCAFCVRFL